ncbi:MAG TPA: hypothetical protein VF941_03135 [Clostridia bacterium]
MQDFINQIVSAAEQAKQTAQNVAASVMAPKTHVKAASTSPTYLPASQIQNDLQGKPVAVPQATAPLNPTQQITQGTTSDPAYHNIATDIASTVASPFVKETPQQLQNNQNLAENFFGGIQGGPESEMLAPTVNAVTDLAKTGLKAGAQTAKEGVGIASDKATEIGNGIKDAMGTAQGQPGGLQAGFLKLPGEEPASPSVLYDAQGNPITKPQPENGGGYINVAGTTPKGGTPGQVKGRPIQPVNMQYVPPAQETGLPALENKAQGLPPIDTNAPQGASSATMNEEPTVNTNNNPQERTYPANNQSHLTPSARQRQLPIDGKYIKDASQQQQVNATLDGYGITHGTSFEQLNAAKKQGQMLQDTIENYAKGQQGTINKGQLINDVAFDFMKNNMYPGQEEYMANQLVDSAFKRSAADTMMQTRSVAPDTISAYDAVKMKGRAGDDANSTFTQPDDTKWTDEQRGAHVLWDNLDNQIDSQFPAIKKLNNDQSDLINAQQGLRNGANNEIKQLAQQNPSFLKKHWKAISGLGVGLGLPLTIAGVTVATGLPSSKNGFNNESPKGIGNSQTNGNNTNGIAPQNNILYHTQSISDGSANVNQTDPVQVKPNADGNWSTFDPTQLRDANGKQVIMNETDYKKDTAQITDYMNANPGNSTIQTQGQNALAQLKIAYTNSQNALTLNAKTKQALNSINDAQNMLSDKSADPQFTDAFQINLGPVNIGAQNLHEAINSDYRTLRQQLITIDNAFPELGLNVASANSTQAAQQLLTQAAQKIIANQNQQIQTKFGSVTMEQNTPTPTGNQNTTIPPGPAGGGENNGYTPQPSGSVSGGSYQFTQPNPMFQRTPLPTP